MEKYTRFRYLANLFAKAYCSAKIRGDNEKAEILQKSADKYFDRYGLAHYYHGFGNRTI